MDLMKPPGVAETLDCVQGLRALEKDLLDAAAAEHALGCVCKSVEDSQKIMSAGIEKLLHGTR
jgi:hypothetical protein